MSIQPEALAWLRQTATLESSVTAQAILHLLERVEALEQRPIPGFVELAASTPEAAPVATDEELRSVYSGVWGDGHGPALRAVYNLGCQNDAKPPAAQPEPPVAPKEKSALAQQAYVAFVQICKGNSDDAGTYAEDEELVRQALKHLDDLEQAAAQSPAAEPAADRVLVSCPETCWIHIRRIADGKVIYSNHRKGELVISIGEPPAAPAAPAGGLVERVATEMQPGTFHWSTYESEARAAIREVAAWLDERGMHGCSLWLREEIDRA
jgi:hypothetical protein